MRNPKGDRNDHVYPRRQLRVKNGFEMRRFTRKFRLAAKQLNTRQKWIVQRIGQGRKFLTAPLNEKQGRKILTA